MDICRPSQLYLWLIGMVFGGCMGFSQKRLTQLPQNRCFRDKKPLFFNDRTLKVPTTFLHRKPIWEVEF